jgi:hypothetical protein
MPEDCVCCHDAVTPLVRVSRRDLGRIAARGWRVCASMPDRHDARQDDEQLYRIQYNAGRGEAVVRVLS